MQTLIDIFELPAPAIETYRSAQMSPRMSIDLEIDFEDENARVPSPAPSSDRWNRARCWSSED